MFELEVDHASFPSTELPEEIQARFAESLATVRAFSLLPWEEHCTECAMPQCYQTCDLYEPRKDGKCRRFHYGFGYVGGVHGVLGYVSKVSFKRWGQLMAYANAALVPVERARRAESLIASVDRAVARVPDARISLLGRAGISSRLTRRVKQRIAHSEWWVVDHAARPSSFLVEVYNPQPRAVDLSLVIRDADGPLRDRPFQELLRLTSGFSRIRIPFERIAPHIDPARQFHITLCPNLLEPSDEGLTLYFGLVSFVQEFAIRAATPPASAPYEPGVLANGAKHVKVVAWDLDNTLWDGVLVEDGEDAVRLKPGVLDVVRELDRRGIVNSVVSKNDADVALPVLQKLGVAEYLVFPKISWNPKSHSVAQLIEAFNVGPETIAVVDDSPFERAEIAQGCADVRVYPDTAVATLLDLPEFRPRLSNESAQRRAFYQTEEKRVAESEAFQGDYLSFVRDCNLVLEVRRTTPDNVARAHELIQRTNQLNFSGHRYSREAVEELVRGDHTLPLSLRCRDRFGDYGLVGFCVVDLRTATLTDLMFSCRVQAKRVEHAFLEALMRWLRERGAVTLQALYTRTAKNGQAAKVFEDMGFTLAERDEHGVRHAFSFDLQGELPRQDVIDVDWNVTS
jgi:FkbH-like protein